MEHLPLRPQNETTAETKIGSSPPPVRFSSLFESGNLKYVVCTDGDGPCSEYDLVLDEDANTKGHTQWFYFCVANMHKDTTIRLNIVNMVGGGCSEAPALLFVSCVCVCLQRKPRSLYEVGMQPMVFSGKLSRPT